MQFLTNLSIVKKIALAFIVVFTTAAIGLSVNLTNLRTIKQNEDWVNHTYNVIQRVNLIVASMVDQETGMRAYLLAADEKFLEPFHGGRKTFDEQFATVVKLTSDNPAQQARLQGLEKHVRTWQNDIAGRQLQLMKDPNTRAEAARMEISGAGKTAMDGVRRAAAEIIDVEAKLLVTRKADSVAAFDASFSVTFIALGMMALLSVLASFALFRGVSRPIGLMTGVMSRLAKNDTSVEVPYVARKDEVGTMAQAVEVFKKNALDRERLES
jgi:methyl-accepting chemotaxis protein